MREVDTEEVVALTKGIVMPNSDKGDSRDRNERTVAALKEIFSEITQQTTESRQLIVQQGTRLEDIARQLTSISTAQEGLRKELAERTASLAQLGQRFDNMNAQVSMLGTKQEGLMNDLTTKWQALPDNFMPRREHQAIGLEGRMLVQEEFRSSIVKEMSDLKSGMQQQVQQAVLMASKDISTATLTAKDDVNTARKDLDARAIMIALTVINVIIGVGMHFIH